MRTVGNISNGECRLERVRGAFDHAGTSDEGERVPPAHGDCPNCDRIHVSYSSDLCELSTVAAGASTFAEGYGGQLGVDAVVIEQQRRPQW
jgi:hypothetical protein